MLMKACAKCGRLMPYGAPRCQACEKGRAAERAEGKARSRRRYDKRRDPRFKSFYNSKAWRRLSAATLAEAAWRCEDCGGLAVEVHHEPPIQTKEGWDRRLDASICHALCLKCHNKRHGRF